MPALVGCFTQALVSIEPSVDDKQNAPVAHDDVRAVLREADELKRWDLDPVLIGSYKRDVSIRRVKDVDLFSRMRSIDPSVEPAEVLDAFFAALSAAYDGDNQKRVRRQARSLQVEFPEFDGLYVDVVPARARADGCWEIPERDSGLWQRTNPERLTELKTAMNEQMLGRYVPAVKLLRQTRRTILASKPGGLFVELAFYDGCLSGEVQHEDIALTYVSGLEAIAARLAAKVACNRDLPDPTVPGAQLQFRATDLQWQAASERFARAAADARQAYLEADAGIAALTFRRLLGANGDGDVAFPMPAGYDDDGSKKTITPIVAGDDKIPAGDRRFG